MLPTLQTIQSFLQLFTSAFGAQNQPEITNGCGYVPTKLYKMDILSSDLAHRLQFATPIHSSTDTFLDFM